MKRRCVLAGALLALAACTGDGSPAKLKGATMPALAVRSFTGTPQTLDAWTGRVTVLNVWASWCPPCLEEMPSLQGLHEQLKGEGLVVVGVSVDEGAREAQEVLRDARITYVNWHDPDGHSVMLPLDVEGLPTTFVVGRDGRVLQVFTGIAEYDTPKAVDYFRRLLRD